MADFEVGTGASVTELRPGDKVGMVRSGQPQSADIGALVASSTDARFYGIERVDLRKKYAAPLDGTSHPMTAAAALAAYPQCGATGTIEQDTAAWLQAEYDLRTGPGGIIALPDGARMMVSQQLFMQDATRVWFHGNRDVALITEACGSTPAVRVASAQSNRAPVLRGLRFQAFANGVHDFPQFAGGVVQPGFASSAAQVAAGTPGYLTGATALFLDSVNAETCFEFIEISNYDRPIKWGDNVFCITFAHLSLHSNNYGLFYGQANVNSMEQMRFIKGSISNNNTGALIDATVGGGSQGGSWHFVDTSWDYNIKCALDYLGNAAGNANTNNEVHIRGGHIENVDACTGPNTCWIQHRAGALFLTDVPLYIGGGAPTGIIQIGDAAHGSVVNSRINGNSTPIFFSPTTAAKNAYVTGCTNQATNTPVTALRDGNGDVAQAYPTKRPISLFGDAGLPIAYQNCLICCNQSTLTLPHDSDTNHAIGTSVEILASNSGGTTVQATAPALVEGYAGLGTTVAGGTTGRLLKIAANHWVIYMSALPSAAAPITGVEIDGSTIVASMSSPYQMATADRVVDVNKTTPAPTKLLLPTNPLLWVDYSICDGRGDAGTNTITVAGASGTTINGAATFVMNANYDALVFRAINATTWRIM